VFIHVNAQQDDIAEISGTARDQVDCDKRNCVWLSGMSACARLHSLSQYYSTLRIVC
jgi:hypothetical protein